MAFLRGGNVLLGSGVSLWDLLVFAALVTPTLIQLSLPIAFLLAILLGIGRLSDDGEITAMQSVGVGPLRLLVGPVTLALAIGGVTLALACSLEPWGQRGVRHAANELIKKNLVGD